MNDSDATKLKAEIEKLRKDFSAVTETLKQLSAQQAHESVDLVYKQAKETRRQVEEKIRERPITSVAAAFGAGYILAKLLDR